jgi:hypothetical protein
LDCGGPPPLFSRVEHCCVRGQARSEAAGQKRHSVSFPSHTMIGLPNFIEICSVFPFIMLKKLFLFQNGFRIFSVSTEVDESAAS